MTIFRRPIWAVAALVAILAVAMAFPPVRAFAGSFLGIFRVQQVRVVSFDPAALESYKGTLQDSQSKFEAFFKEYLTITRHGEFAQVKTALNASRLAGFTPRLPAGMDISSLGVNPAETATLKIDSATMNTFLKALGRTDVSIPSSLDGQEITVTVPSFVTAEFIFPGSDGASSTARLVQVPSPTVNAPDAFPVIQLGESMFQMMGMTPEQAHQLSQSIDWGSTLVVPVPSGQGMSLTQVSVDGVTGHLVQDSKNQQYTIFWVKDGIVYGIVGSGSPTEALKVANSLQ